MHALLGGGDIFAGALLKLAGGEGGLYLDGEGALESEGVADGLDVADEGVVGTPSGQVLWGDLSVCHKLVEGLVRIAECPEKNGLLAAEPRHNSLLLCFEAVALRSPLDP